MKRNVPDRDNVMGFPSQKYIKLNNRDIERSREDDTEDTKDGKKAKVKEETEYDTSYNSELLLQSHVAEVCCLV
jgi:hypothetical protein